MAKLVDTFFVLFPNPLVFLFLLPWIIGALVLFWNLLRVLGILPDRRLPALRKRAHFASSARIVRFDGIRSHQAIGQDSYGEGSHFGAFRGGKDD